ncbi:MAG: CaiB/BaiF CoA transferase family protein [Smithellaceae bacterium]
MARSKAKKETLLGCYRILEIADEQGEYGGKRLADLGADVIKIEPPQGNKTRLRGPFFHDEIGLEKSLNFLHFNTNKRSITLNLEHRDGQELFKKLVKEADGVLESMPVGYLSSLGLDYKSLLALNPALVMTSITPFGQTGPHKDYKGTDIVNMAMGGVMQSTGDPAGMPLRPGCEASYEIAGQNAAVDMMAALYHKSMTGKGQFVDVSMQECVLTNGHEQAILQDWNFHKHNVVRAGSRTRWAFPYGMFPCKDGFAIIAAVQAGEWKPLAKWIHEVTGCSEVMDDMFNGTLFDRAPYVDILTEYLLDFSMRLTKNELFVEGQKRRIPVMPVQSIEDIMKCPQLKEWGYFKSVNHPVVGELKDIGSPDRHAEGGLEGWKAAPLLGEHNEEIYCSELGLTKGDLAVLRTNGVI